MHALGPLQGVEVVQLPAGLLVLPAVKGAQDRPAALVEGHVAADAFMRARVYVRVSMRACVCMCVCAHVCVCVRACVSVGGYFCVHA